MDIIALVIPMKQITKKEESIRWRSLMHSFTPQSPKAVRICPAGARKEPSIPFPCREQEPNYLSHLWPPGWALVGRWNWKQSQNVILGTLAWNSEHLSIRGCGDKCCLLEWLSTLLYIYPFAYLSSFWFGFSKPKFTSHIPSTAIYLASFLLLHIY